MNSVCLYRFLIILMILSLTPSLSRAEYSASLSTLSNVVFLVFLFVELHGFLFFFFCFVGGGGVI